MHHAVCICVSWKTLGENGEGVSVSAEYRLPIVTSHANERSMLHFVNMQMDVCFRETLLTFKRDVTTSLQCLD